jgi:hypothetical protein
MDTSIYDRLILRLNLHDMMFISFAVQELYVTVIENTALANPLEVRIINLTKDRGYVLL